jgi:hypothetical protein
VPIFSFPPSIQWRTNLAAMSRVAAGQSLTVNQLVDMEWKFGGMCVYNNYQYNKWASLSIILNYYCILVAIVIAKLSTQFIHTYSTYSALLNF